MPLPYLVQFVDKITASPAVRLDVCTASWILRPESDLSPPPLRRAVASTLLTDGEIVPAAVYGNRLIRLELRLQTGFDEDAAATHLQRLARELDRPANILRWQPGTSSPVFFRTLRAEFGSVRWDPVTKTATVLIPAEPFAYGVREVLAAATVYPDPARPSSALNANPYFETNVAGWTGTSATLTRSTVRAHEGAASMLVATTGTPVQALARAEVPVTAGMSYTASVWCYSVAGYADVSVSIDWYTGPGSTGYLSTSNSGIAALAAATWTQRAVTGMAPAGAAFAQVGPTVGSNPPAATQVWCDEAQIGVIGDGGANGCYFDVSGVRGDVETPLILRLPATLDRTTSVFSIRRRGTPAATPFLVQAEALSLGTDTTLPGNDPLMSGTGANYARTTFATQPLMVPRVFGSLNALAGADIRGTYRVFGRIRHSVAGDVIAVQLQWGFGLTPVTNDAVTLNGATSVDATSPHYYDLGLVQMPVGADPVTDGYSGVELPVEPTTAYVQAQRVSGSGNVEIDHLLFVPADDRLLLVTWPVGTDTAVLDGAHEMLLTLLTTGTTRVVGATGGQLAGGFPMVSPDTVNRIFMVRRVNSGLVGADTLTGTVVITPEYYPRYLYVAPVGS